LKKLFFFSLGVIALGANSIVFAQTKLSEVGSLYVNYAADQEIEGCGARVVSSLTSEGLHAVPDEARADATLNVKVKTDRGGLRPNLEWAAVLVARDGTRLFSESGSESGWSLPMACDDVASNLAEELADAMKEARQAGF